MADPVTQSATVAAAPNAPPLARPRPNPYVPRRRFGIAYLILALLVGAAVGLTVVFATNSHHKATVAAWSAWQPDATGTLGVRDIARHVAPEYRLPGGQQLVAVLAGPMQIPTASGPIPVSAILVSSGSAGTPQEHVDVDFPSGGVFYQLRGSGTNGEIPGRATVARGQLLIREVVELALYTFHYLPQADNVVAFLPPAAGVPATDPQFQRAIYVPRSALARQLAEPLARTLQVKPRLTPQSLSRKQRNAVSGLVTGRLFHYDFRQAADNSALLVLSPLEP